MKSEKPEVVVKLSKQFKGKRKPGKSQQSAKRNGKKTQFEVEMKKNRQRKQLAQRAKNSVQLQSKSIKVAINFEQLAKGPQ